MFVDTFNDVVQLLGVPLVLIITCLITFSLVLIAYFVVDILLQVVTGICGIIHPTTITTFGEWAVVTGCTDGIGKCYAKLLAKRGMNIILISRNIDRLKQTAHEIGKQTNAKTLIIQADFGLGQPVYDEIAQQIKGKEIGILVNNVGYLQELPTLVGEMDEADVWSLLRVNIESVTAMTRLVLPQMVARQKGAIVNLSSAAGVLPTPLLTIYSAAKAYVDFFSQGLEIEYRSKGITVQTLIPYYVATNMTKYNDKIGKPGLFVPTAEQYATSALATLGYSKRTTGYWSHSLQLWMSSLVPPWILSNILYCWNLRLRRDTLQNRSEDNK